MSVSSYYYAINRCILPLAIVFATLFMLPGCSKTDTIQDNKQTWEQPYFGFNAKGLLNTGQQVSYAQQNFSQMHSWIKPNIVIRVTGGTASQTAFENDWTNETISQWTALQQQHQLRFIYVVNGNDSPKNQHDIIQKWISAGARFEFLEMMNEYYLPKFIHGDTSFEEVSRVVTPEIYANEILPEFWEELDRFNLPYFIIFAPSRPDKPDAQQKMDHWNRVMLDSVIQVHPQRNIHATLHLYDSGDDLSSFDYDQIRRLRLQLPEDRHIAVTEAGIVNGSLNSDECGLLAVAHFKNLLAQLQKSDYLLDQVLYNTSANNNTANLSPGYSGITPKGTRILQFVNNQLQ